MEEGYNNIVDRRDGRIASVKSLAGQFLDDYRVKNPRSSVFAEYAIRHVVEHLGQKMVVDIDAETVRQYQTTRRREAAAPKTVNEEVGVLLRLLGDHGDALRTHLKIAKCLKLKERQTVSKAFSQEQKETVLDAPRAPEPRKGRGRGQ